MAIGKIRRAFIRKAALEAWGACFLTGPRVEFARGTDQTRVAAVGPQIWVELALGARGTREAFVVRIVRASLTQLTITLPRVYVVCAWSACKACVAACYWIVLALGALDTVFCPL